MEVENPTRDYLPLRSNFTPFNIHQRPYKIFEEYLTFEIKVIYMRIISSSSTNMQSSSSIMNLIFLPRDLRSCLQINGLKINPREKISRPLNRHRSDALMSESIYVNTDRINFKGFSLPFEIQIQDSLSSSSSSSSSSESSVLVSGDLRRKVYGFKVDDDCMWIMECKESCNGHGVRTEFNGGSVDVYFAGRSFGKPLVLNGLVDLKKWEKGFDFISHEDCETVLNDNSKEYAEIPDEGFDEYKYKKDAQKNGTHVTHQGSIHIEEEVSVEEEEVSWFNAGVRVGIGLGLGMCLGVGVGLGLIVRTYKTTSGTLRKFIF